MSEQQHDIVDVLRKDKWHITGVDAERAAQTIEELRAELSRLQAAGGQGVEPLFLLHTGQIDSSGEQDEWETEADSGQRVDEFCAKHPGQTVKLFAHPPAAPADDADAAVRLAPNLHIGACITDGKLHASVMHKAGDGPITFVAIAEMDATSLHKRDCIAKMQPAAPALVPLTDEQIDKLPWGPHEGSPMTFAEGLRDFARAIERAHGINGLTVGGDGGV